MNKMRPLYFAFVIGLLLSHCLCLKAQNRIGSVTGVGGGSRDTIPTQPDTTNITGTLNTLSGETLVLPQMIPPSPKSSAMTRYGDYPVSLFTGLVDISVPVYTIARPWIQVPVTFKYHTSGIKYDDVSGEVGLGWTLLAGGTVQYSARGAVDGNSTFVREAGSIDPTSNGNLYSDHLSMKAVADGGQLYPENPGTIMDGETDLYSFNFLDYSGQLYFPIEHPYPLFIPARPLKVLNRWGPIEFLDSQGIRYTFQLFESDGGYNRNRSYYLTRILAPGATDSITFEYTRYAGFGEGVDRPYIQGAFTIKEEFPDLHEVFGSWAHATINNSMELSAQTYYPARLNRIRFSGGRVEFEYYNNQPTSRDLRYVKVFNNTEATPLQSISLSKSRFDGNRFDRLDRVDFTNREGQSYNYQFGYDSSPWTGGAIDYWGYYNGKPVGSASYTPKAEISVIGYDGGYTINGSDRDANENIMRKGVLNQVTYPTGGYSLFTYEGNRAFSAYNVYGGLRIQNIQHFDTDGKMAWEKWYKYGAGESGYGMTQATLQIENFCLHSKILTEYVHPDGLISPCLGYHTDIRQYLAFPKISYFTCGSPVVYSEVAEYTGSGNNILGKTVYHYNYVPDEPDSSSFARPGSIDTYRRNYSWRSGLLGEKIDYKYENNTWSEVRRLSNSYKVINEEEYLNLRVLPYVSINGNPEIFKNFSSYSEYKDVMCNSSYWCSPFDYFNYYTNTGLSVLESSNETTDGVTRRTEYKDFSSYGDPGRVEVIQSDGSRLSTVTRRPYDFPSTPVYQAMTDANILSPVVESVTTNGSTAISAQRTNYFESSTGKYAPQSVQAGKDLASLETRINYLRYDAYNNPLHIAKDNAEEVVYLWGYGHTYPIAEIKGASYDQVKAAIAGGESTIQALSASMNPDLSPLDALRTSSVLKGALVTTCTYNALLGIRSVTDPRGIKTEYASDGFGRLTGVSLQGKAQQSYDYNYKP